MLRHIPYHRNYGADASVYNEIMNALSTTGAPVIVLITTRAEVQGLFAARQRHPVMGSDRFLWAGVDDWVDSEDIVSPVGTIGLVPQPIDTEYDLGEAFLALWQTVDPNQYPDADGDRSSLSTYAGYAVDAVFGLALAHQSVVNSDFDGDENQRGNVAYSELINSVSFIGVTGKVDFDANGDRLYAHYDVMNVNGGGTNNWGKIGYTISLDSGSYGSIMDLSRMTWPDGSVGPSAATQNYANQYIPFCPPGYEAIFNAGSSVYGCTACSVGYYKPVPGTGRCEQCPEGAQCDDIAVTVPCVSAGYWRAQPPPGKEGDFSRYKIFECDRKGRCKGGCQLNATCASSFKQDSPVCGVCLEGFYQSSFEDCSECPADINLLNAMETTFIIFALLLGFLFLFCLYTMYVAGAHRVRARSLFFGRQSADGNKDNALAGPTKSDASFTPKQVKHGDRFKFSLRATSVTLQAALRAAKSSGLFVTVKLTVSFVQVLIGIHCQHIKCKDLFWCLFCYCHRKS